MNNERWTTIRTRAGTRRKVEVLAGALGRTYHDIVDLAVDALLATLPVATAKAVKTLLTSEPPQPAAEPFPVTREAKKAAKAIERARRRRKP